MEGAGQVEAVGEGVTEFKPGDRIAYASPPVGAYAEVRLIPPTGGGAARRHRRSNRRRDDAARHDRAIPVAAHLSGATRRRHPAACRRRWGRVDRQPVGAAPGRDRDRHGGQRERPSWPAPTAAITILYNRENFVEQVREITGGQGVAAVYDSVGKMLMGSLDCLRPLGMMVSFGNASGPVPPFETGDPGRQGFVVLDPAQPDGLHGQARRFAGQRRRTVRGGFQRAVKIEVHQTYPLAETACAHRDLERAKTTSSTVLLP